VGSVVLGLLAGSGASPVLVLAALLAPAVLAGTLLRPDLGLLVLVLMVFTRLSDVAVAFHSTPSVLQPFPAAARDLVGSAFLSARRRAIGHGTADGAVRRVRSGPVAVVVLRT
jgi:hypothetical protein